MDITELIQQAEQYTDALQPDIEYISDFIFHNPELGGSEYISCQFLCDTMVQHGFQVTQPYCDLETAFRAEFGNASGPTIAFLAEYDALPGFGEDGTALAHACGHNWLSANAVGTAIVLSKLAPYFQGKIVLIGTPAVENYGSKVDMIQKDAFDDVDIVIQSHIESLTNINCSIAAMDAIEFAFRGKAAHAASYPEEGINALDATQLTFIGINFLRQRLSSGVKIHGIITDGGDAPGIIPDRSASRFYIRADTRNLVESVSQKVIHCAEGAALMTGTELHCSHFEHSYNNLINIPVLQSLAQECLLAQGITDLYTKNDFSSGSSDIGNVSYVCPTLYMEINIDSKEPFRIHDSSALSQVNGKDAYTKLNQIVKSMVTIALRLYLSPDTIINIKKQHRELLSKSILTY